MTGLILAGVDPRRRRARPARAHVPHPRRRRDDDGGHRARRRAAAVHVRPPARRAAALDARHRLTQAAVRSRPVHAGGRPPRAASAQRSPRRAAPKRGRGSMRPPSWRHVPGDGAVDEERRQRVAGCGRGRSSRGRRLGRAARVRRAWTSSVASHVGRKRTGAGVAGIGQRRARRRRAARRRWRCESAAGARRVERRAGRPAAECRCRTATSARDVPGPKPAR